MFEFDPYSKQVDADPFPLYRTLRDEYPCFWSEQANMWVLSRHEDVSTALQDWQTYSSSKGNLMDELPDRAGATLGSTDPPRHDRMRAIINAAFAKKYIDYLVEPTKALANQSIDDFFDRGHFEFIDDFSSRVTVGILFFMMGLPEGDHRAVRNDVVLTIQSDPETRRKSDESIEAFKRLTAYAENLVAERRANPGDDLISRLIQAEIDGEHLTDREVLMTTTTLIMAGVESLSSFMAMFALNMHDFPDARRRVVADPNLTLPAIEESLRFNTSAQRFRRVLMRDVELHGQTMRQGDFVCLCYGSGNRDERKFPIPDVYDIERRPRGHLGFGGGKHLCLGTAIARLVTQHALDELFKRVPEFHLTDTNLDWNPSTTFRAPVALPFAFA